MLNLFLVCTNNIYYKNSIFNLDDPRNRDDAWYPDYLLKNFCLKSNILLNTYDYLNKETYKNFELLFFDIPRDLNKYIKIYPEINKYLVIWECPSIRRDNWDVKNHKYFKKIFTWNDKLIDNKKYFKINFSSKIPTDLNFDLNKKDKLCTMIVANKFKSHPLELYTERVKAIRWFEVNHPEDFDLYGIGWERYYFRGMLSRLNRFDALTKLLKPKYPSYKGLVKSKREVLQKYKFAICYENARDIPGYITEKIFDCFFAGCVPVYLGAPNVTEHIPEDTFIDKRNFNTYEELYSYLKNIPDKEYLNYLEAIKNFIKSDKMYPFSAECFAEILVDEILRGENNE